MTRCFYCLGEHQTQQCLSRSTDRIVSGQEDAAETVCAAIEGAGYVVAEQLREVGADLLGGPDGIREVVVSLHEFLSWAHSETMWRMEKQIEILTGISDMLKNPRATQANELYMMGIDSFKRGRLADAKRLLQEAGELNPGDYRVHVTLGHTCALMGDQVEALRFFQAAVDYARDKVYRRSALLLTSRTHRCLGQIDDAVSNAEEASSMTPAHPPAQYELACCLAEMIGGSTTRT